jgi:hypothetical protein
MTDPTLGDVKAAALASHILQHSGTDKKADMLHLNH